MKKFYNEVVSLVMIGGLGYMIYTGDYTYLNVIAVLYFLILLPLTTLIPLVYLMLHSGNPKVREDVIVKCKESLCYKNTTEKLWGHFKSVLTIVALAMTGHSILLG